MTEQKLMKFGDAIDLLEAGKKVSRLSWNGKGMFIYLVPAASYPIQRNSNKTLAGVFAGDVAPYQAYLAMKTAQNVVTPWSTTQSDVLDSDWYVVG